MRPSPSVSPRRRLSAASELDRTPVRVCPPRYRAREWRRIPSCRESSRLHPMGTRDLVLVGVDEGSSAHDVSALDDEPIDAVRRREDEAGDRDPPRHTARARPCARRRSPRVSPARASQCRASRAPCASSRPEPKGFARRHRRRTASPSRDEKACFTSFRRSPRSFEADPSTPRPTRHSGVEVLADGREAGAEPEIRGRAVRDAGLRGGEVDRVVLRQVDAVRAPDIGPSQPRSVRYSTGVQP